MTYARYAERSQIDFVSKGILAVAAVGWGLFAFSVLSSGSDEQAEIAHLRQQVETMTAERTKLVQEQEQIIQTSGIWSIFARRLPLRHRKSNAWMQYGRRSAQQSTRHILSSLPQPLGLARSVTA
jgi:hypothetical protein